MGVFYSNNLTNLWCVLPGGAKFTSECIFTTRKDVKKFLKSVEQRKCKSPMGRIWTSDLPALLSFPFPNERHGTALCVCMCEIDFHLFTVDVFLWRSAEHIDTKLFPALPEIKDISV